MSTITQTARYGTATAQAWDRLHPRLTHRAETATPDLREDDAPEADECDHQGDP